MPEGKSIINFGDLTKPLTVLIEKISDATGVLYEPKKIRKKASAKADAAIIKAEAKAKTDIIEEKSAIKCSEVQKRAADRWLKQEERKQKNIESIITKALPMVDSNAKTEEIEEDWLAYFFKNCDIVSDEERQTLWAKILAGEANQAGKYSRRTINFVATMDKKDADLFTKLCQFTWNIVDDKPIVYNYKREIFEKAGIDFDSLHHLEAMGLITVNYNETMIYGDDIPVGSKKNSISPIKYFAKSIFLHVAKNVTCRSIRFMTGMILFTEIGRELAPICGAVENEDFFMETLQTYYNNGIIMSSKWPRELVD